MPSGSFINGTFSRRPGTTAQPNFDANAGIRTNPKRLCVVGDFPFLQQARPALYSSQASMLRAAPLSQYLKRAVSAIFNASKDKRVGKPTEVILVNAGVSTQASATLVDGAAAGTLTLKPRSWGYKGNRTKYALTESSGKYTFTFTSDGKVETIGPISGVDLFAIAYSGNDTFTCAGGFNSSHEFFVTASKAAIAVGTFSPACVWGGIVSVTPSAAASGGSITATITGTNKVTGTTGDTDTITWTDGQSGLKSSTKQFSLITSIVFANAGGGTPTFTVSGDMVRATKAQYPTVKLLTDFLSTLSSDLTVTSVSNLVASILTEDIDVKASTSIATAVTFSCIKARIVAALEESGTVEVTDIAAGSVPVAASGYFTGGTETDAGAGDWATALASVTRSWRANVIALLTDNATGHTALATHCTTMWGVGRRSVQGWTGTAAQATKATITARPKSLNDYRVQVCPQEAKIDLIDGYQERVAPYWYALMHAAMQCGVGVADPLTWKRPNVVEVYDGPDWDVRTTGADIEEILGASLVITTDSEVGLRIERSLSTHVEDDDDARTAPSAVEGLGAFIERVRDRLDPLIGDPAKPTTSGRVESLVDTETTACLRDEYGISAYDPTRTSVEQVGGRWVITVGVAPIYEITGIDFVPAILPQSFQI